MRFFTCLLTSLTLAACGSNAQHTEQHTAIAGTASHKTDTTAVPAKKEAAATAQNVPVTGEVPILCYHQIRDYKPTDSKTAKVYIVPVAVFKEQMQLLHDSGYHTILPDQLMAYRTSGAGLPPKPVLITFDDGDGPQYDVALPELDKYGFKAAFFIMTVVLNRPNYLSRDQVKALAAQGHTIGCHTWDHHMVTKYTEEDWKKQVEKPRAELEKLAGQPVKYFAYPFGLWNPAAVQRLEKYGFTAAFSLAKVDHDHPQLTISRQIVDGGWSAKRFMGFLHSKEHAKDAGKEKH